jgi:rhodanese-related sulfurtransferase
MQTYLDFISNHLVLVSALMVSFFLLVFTELQRKARGITSLDPQEAVKLINADATVIDFRNAESFSRGHIVNAKNIPHDELDDELEKIKRFKGRPVVAVCDSGTTSAKVVGRLRRAGFENVYGLKGGINEEDEIESQAEVVSSEEEAPCPSNTPPS